MDLLTAMIEQDEDLSEVLAFLEMIVSKMDKEDTIGPYLRAREESRGKIMAIQERINKRRQLLWGSE